MKKIKLRNKEKNRLIIHDQWIEVHRVDGVTVTTFYPPNKEFERLRLEMDTPPDLIYRRLNFFGGVPDEYLWCDPPINTLKHGGQFLQRMPASEWQYVLKAEELLGNKQYVQPRKTVGRPAQFGLCPCERCTYERENNLPSRFDEL